MPRRTSMRRRAGYRTRGGALRLAGGSKGAKRVLDFFKKANAFLRKSRAISRGMDEYGKTSLPYARKVGAAAKYPRSLGYGRRRY